MSKRAPMIFALLALGLLLAAVTTRPASGGSSLPGTGGSPVVVELFTSQGCSSCPPADRLLSRLGREGLEGTPIIPLSYHVDYWNHIGWQDPFSQARWSQRQEEYADSLGKGRLYTPQAVVQGMEDCVGSRSRCLEEAILRAAGRPPRADLVVQYRLQPAGNVVVEAMVRPRPGAAAAPSGSILEAVAIIFEKGLETDVSRGENARKRLRNDYVVRSLEPIVLEPAISLRAPQVRESIASSGQVTLDLDPDWSRGRLGVAVLLQESDSRHIVAAWAQDLFPQ